MIFFSEKPIRINPEPWYQSLRGSAPAFSQYDDDDIRAGLWILFGVTNKPFHAVPSVLDCLRLLTENIDLPNK